MEVIQLLQAAAFSVTFSCVLPYTKKYRSLLQQTAHQHMLCKSHPLENLSLCVEIFIPFNNRHLQLPKMSIIAQNLKDFIVSAKKDPMGLHMSVSDIGKYSQDRT